MSMDAENPIQARAYALWEAEGRPEGRDLDHWLRAEADAASRRSGPVRPKAPAGPKRRVNSRAAAKGRAHAGA